VISRLHYGSSVFFESNVPFQQTHRYVRTDSASGIDFQNQHV
jgi:hypothetical protein